MPTCQYCNGIVNEGQTDCPHCGSSLIVYKVEQPNSSKAGPLIPAQVLNFAPVYYKGLAFWQNIIVMIFVGYLIALVYFGLMAVAFAFFVPKSAIVMSMLISSIIAYFLAVLTLLSYYKKKAASVQYILFNDSIHYSNKGMKNTFAIKDVENVSVDKSARQEKYGVGTLIIHFRPKASELNVLKMKNVEKPDSICNKILELRDTARRVS